MYLHRLFPQGQYKLAVMRQTQEHLLSRRSGHLQVAQLPVARAHHNHEGMVYSHYNAHGLLQPLRFFDQAKIPVEKDYLKRLCAQIFQFLLEWFCPQLASALKFRLRLRQQLLVKYFV